VLFTRIDGPTPRGKGETESKEGDDEPEKDTSIAFAFNFKPADIKAHLDRFVIRQDEAKKVLATAVCDHYHHARMLREDREQHPDSTPLEFSKQNVIIIGPTGVGKTYLVKRIADLIGVPFVKADATKFSETGYVGGDVDDLVRDLYRRAGNDAKKAEHGIIYLDEVDKLATRDQSGGRDVSGRGVQTNLLKLMEDGEVPLTSPNDMTGQLQAAMTAMRGGGGAQPETLNTRHILFIVSGAFSGLAELIRRRLVAAPLDSRNPRPEKNSDDELFQRASTADIVQYGLEPEFIGRLPVRVACHGLDTDDLFNVLRKSESSLIHQYERAFAAYGITCEFRDDGLRRLAERATGEHTGARGLMTVCERVFRDLKFRLPSSKVKRFEVTAALVDDPAAALKQMLR
jgi:endopeptidase Clp ATP-binding regulatory subunit ClpX